MHGSETWRMKVEHELKMNRTENTMIRCMCGAKLNERKKIEEHGGGNFQDWNQSVCMIKKSRLRWFGHVERKDDNDWVNVVQHGQLKELDREDARKRPGGIVLRMTWKIQSVPKGCAVQE